MKDTFTILLLEDNPYDATLIQDQLEQSGLPFTLHTVSTKESFHEALSTMKPQIVLSDENLPSYNGMNAYKDMRKSGRNIPFIIITGELTDEFTGRIIHSGIDDYLLKDRLSRLPKAIINAIERKQAELEKEIHRSEIAAREKQYRHTLDNMLEGAQIHDFDWKYLYVNDALVKHSGYSKDQLLGYSMLEKYPGIEQTEVFQVLKQCMDNRTSRHMETEFVFPNGSTLDFELSIQPVPEGLFVLSVDITEKKKAKEKLLKANRLYSFISAINQSIVRIRDEEELLINACTIAVDIGKYKMAWIGLIDAKNKLEVKYTRGDESMAAAIQNYSAQDYCTPMLRDTSTGLALRTGLHAVSNDVESDPTMLPFMNEFTKHGIRATISMPIKKFGVVIGIYGFTSTIKNYFDQEEIALLEEAAGDISFALEVMEQDRERKKADESLLQTRALLSEAQQIAHIGNWNYDVRTNKHYWSDGMKEIYGLQKDVAPDISYYVTAMYPDDKEAVSQVMAKVQEHGGSIENYFSIVKVDGEVRTIKARTTGIKESGKLVRLFGVIQDVTELKVAQEELENTLLELEFRVQERTKQLALTNKNILDSILYAERLQKSMFPDIQQLRRVFEHAFILSLPRDIVGGDFCWFYRNRKKIYLVCSDCTGHGVPGAFMSIIGIQLLNKIIIDQDWRYPSLLLELMDDALFHALQDKKGMTITDGMDMCFCVIDIENHKIFYSGAMLPLLVVRNGIGIIHAASRFGLGKYMDSGKKRFETHEIKYQQGDMLYLASDGFRDQFGGKKGKKLGMKSFVKILEENSLIPNQDKKITLHQQFLAWKGENDQVDDVMVLGVEL